MIVYKLLLLTSLSWANLCTSATVESSYKYSQNASTEVPSSMCPGQSAGVFWLLCLISRQNGAGYSPSGSLEPHTRLHVAKAHTECNQKRRAAQFDTDSWAEKAAVPLSASNSGWRRCCAQQDTLLALCAFYTCKWAFCECAEYDALASPFK